ncbi:DUF6207 family protein [Streptomyces flaveolus]|uniref:DUF6207 family protein n=1 Tax=Streptomyces flaveolus TaxID=67297 RepID=UPI00343617A9
MRLRANPDSPSAPAPGWPLWRCCGGCPRPGRRSRGRRPGRRRRSRCRGRAASRGCVPRGPLRVSDGDSGTRDPDAGEPGVRLRCYLDLNQPVGSDAQADPPPQVLAEVQR